MGGNLLKVVHLIKKTAGPELGPLHPCPRILPAPPPSPAPSQEEDRQKLARITKGILLTCRVALGCHFTLLSLSFFAYTTGIKIPFPQSLED